MSDLPTGRVIPVNIEDEVKTSYLNYAMSVIVSRALPDVRDGLKPVHRRILFAMDEMGLRADKPFKKSGRIVGDVLGKYHPHGDQSIYDALVRLAQEFSLRYPVVRGQGNFGSVDGDPPAAMRYTEAKLSKIAEEMLRDIGKETVDFVPNYDDSLKEPSVLPTAFPFLLANGSSGIAVGMATNIAPHNLKEICHALVQVIDNPEITVEELMAYIKGPDFPTAGIIYGRSGILSAFKTGRGAITIRARHHIEETKTGKEFIIVTELPYQVNKAQLIIHIADLVKDKKIEGISDLRDESDRTGMRMVIEVKKGFDKEVVLNHLFQHTNMQLNFNVNNLALVKGRPKLLGLKDMLQEFIAHRKEVITRRSIYDLARAEERAHILEGLKIALENIDEVIRIIKESANASVAKHKLMEVFHLSEVQSQAILDMRLQRLTSLETQKILDELQEVLATIAYLKDLLAHEEKIYGVIKDETIELGEKFGDERRTEIVNEEINSIELEDLIQQEEMVVLITRDGLIKRVPLTEYKTQGRGGKGSFSATLRDEDMIDNVFVCHSHDYVLFITNKGKAYWRKTYMLPEGSRTSKGKHIKMVLEFDEDEEIMTVVSMPEFSKDKYLLMGTKGGMVIRISTYEFRNGKTKGINAITMREGDSLVSAFLTTGTNDVVLITKNGYALRYNEEKIRATGRGAQGVTGIRFKSETDEMVAAIPVYEGELLLLLSEKGYGKRMDPMLLNPKGRGTEGMIAYKPQDKTGRLVGAIPVSTEYDVVCITSQGKTLKSSTDDISEQGRTAMGVRVITLEEGDKVVGLARAFKEVTAPEPTEVKLETSAETVISNSEEEVSPTEE